MNTNDINNTSPAGDCENAHVPIIVTSGLDRRRTDPGSIIARAEAQHASGIHRACNYNYPSTTRDRSALDNEPARYVIYDLETSGLSTRFDQPLEIAAVLCDRDLEPIEVFEQRCDVLPWLVPSPQAMLVTSVRPDQLTGNGRSFYDLIDELTATFQRWRDLPFDDGHGPFGHSCHTLFCGYNSLSFDEEMLRHSFFASLHPPYVTQTRGAGRFDVMLAVRAAYLIEPGSIVVPERENAETGERLPSFRLHDIARANDIAFDENAAHGALADVMVTIAVARLVHKRAPRAFRIALAAADGKGVVRSLLAQLDFGRRENETLQPFINLFMAKGRAQARAVLPIGLMPERSNTIVAIDLGQDPAGWLGRNTDDLHAELVAGRLPLTMIRLNRQPIVLPFDPRLDELPPAAAALVQALAPNAESAGSTAHAILGDHLYRINAVRQVDPSLFERLLRIAAAGQPDWPKSDFVEERLYNGFPSRRDEAQRTRMLAVSPDEFVAGIERFDDERLREHSLRRALVQHPASLSAAQRERLDQWLMERLHHTGDVPWRTLPMARAEVGRLRADCLIALAEGRGGSDVDADMLAKLAAIDEWIGGRISVGTGTSMARCSDAGND